jgi:tRNA threonylcarbamoyladenosine biosynthesis protein TsaE
MQRDFLLSEIDIVAKELLEFNQGKIFLFYGNMGVGKTTLIKSLAKVMGVIDTVSSPTFSLVNEYRTVENNPIFHFDFYRINKEEEALDMGVEEYFDSNAYCFIEWPEKIKNLVPLDAVSVFLSELPNGKRSLIIK